MLFEFQRDTVLGSATNELSLVKPKTVQFYANIRRCEKSHVAPLSFVLAPIRMMLESLKQHHIMVLPISEICCPSGNFTDWSCELVAPFVRW
jgi:hypothetical protein